MSRRLIDRYTDTTAFRFVLLLSGLVVLPVLILGVFTTFVAGTFMLFERPELELEHAVFGLLSLGGVLGFVGYLRAHRGARHASGHNVATTLVLLVCGMAAALVVAGFAAAMVVEGLFAPWGFDVGLLFAAGFAAANVAWALSGAAWGERLVWRWGEETGRAYDGLPVMLLLVALALATAAVLALAAL